MSKNYISASIMCADLLNLKKDLRALEDAGCDYIHVDIMDGVFVPNYTLGTDLVRLLHENTDIPLDIHLMVTEPLKKPEFFDLRETDIVTFHPEAGSDVKDTIEMIRSLGAGAGIAVSPGISLDIVSPFMEELALILMMAVRPGFAGQKMLPEVLPEIRKARALRDKAGSNALIGVDGNVSFENARLMAESGAELFVAGTSGLFRKDSLIAENMIRLRESIRKGYSD